MKFKSSEYFKLLLILTVTSRVELKRTRKTVRNVHETSVTPKYVFIFPEENKKLVFTKSDFQNAVYPNVTNINKFPKRKSKDHESDSQHSSSAITEAFRKLATVDDYDNIVEENVRTERTFVNFMNDLNADLRSEEIKFKGYGKSSKKKVKSENKRPADDDWEALGLEGWTGQLTPGVKGKSKM